METPIHEDGSQEVPEVVAAAIPGVVSVIITADVPVIERYYEEFWSPFGLFNGFQVPRQRQIGTEEQEVGGGTGFFVSADGYVVTNRHVVDLEGARYSVRLNDGTTHPVTVVGRDTVLDIAVLKVADEAAGPFPYLEFATGEARLGETVIAIGNALAEFPNSVSVGVVSGLSRSIVASDGGGGSEALDGLIQTDAAINRGNSGGPLLNLDGDVVGVNVAVAGGSENIGFSIPAVMVTGIVDSVLTEGRIVRPYLGIRYTELTPAIARENGLTVESGILIVRGQDRTDLAVLPGSPADTAGLREGDVLTRFDDTALTTEADFQAALRAKAPGDSVTLTLRRGGEERTVTVTLGEMPTQ